MTPASAAAAITAAETRATELEVSLVVEWIDEPGRLTFDVRRGSARAGSAALAVEHLLDLADDAGIDVAIDVLDSRPGLMRYYGRFGFRAFHDDPDRERSAVARYAEERRALIASGAKEPGEFGVTFMWRDRARHEADRIAA